MRIQAKPMQDATCADLQALVGDQVPGSLVLDYKETLPGWDDSGGWQLLADVSAQANTSGAVLLYGVSERGDNHEQKSDLLQVTIAPRSSCLLSILPEEPRDI